MSRLEETNTTNINEIDRPCIETETALGEASRCLQCFEPPCKKECPADIDVPVFIRRIGEGDIPGAAQKIKEANIFGGICASVCPVEKLCESECTRKKIDAAIDIAGLQGFAIEHEYDGWTKKVSLPPTGEHHVAIVGGGPAGLGCAWELRKMGVGSTIFEKSEIVGGIPEWGIPDFRIPSGLVPREIKFMLDRDIRIESQCEIKDISGLLDKFDCVFLSPGLFDDIEFSPGQGGEFTTKSSDFLRMAKKEQLPDIKGKIIGIIGGGDVAFDVARTALRKGAHPTILYRRTISEMPAEEEEIHNAIEEGVKIRQLTTLVNVKKLDGNIFQARCQQMKLGDKDSTGRSRPVPVENAFYELELGAIVVAIGNTLAPYFKQDDMIQIDKKGKIIVDDKLMTTIPGVFAGGDAVKGPNTVVKAIGDGKKAASRIVSYLGGEI